jgi:hypothetical protein
MKKLAILFLLTTVLAAFTFAQVTVKGGFEVPNVTGANNGDAVPVLYTEFSGSASTPLGPGNIGVAFQLGTALNLTDKVYPYELHGDVYLKGLYSLAAGPGTLAFGISTWGSSYDMTSLGVPMSIGSPAGFGGLEFGVDYDGIAAGPATLGFGVWYDFNTYGRDGTDYAVFGDDPKAEDILGVRVAFGIAGFNLTYKFKYAVGDDSYVKNIAYIDASYQVIDPLKVGLEVDNTGEGSKGGDYFEPLTIKPYVEYAISEKTTAGVFVVLDNLNADPDLEVKPGVWISYAF